MSARRALLEPVDSASEVTDVIPQSCARRAMPAPRLELVDDTLLSVSAARRAKLAIDAPIGFEPDEPLTSTRKLAAISTAKPKSRGLHSRLQRGLMGAAAVATASAALIVPNLSSTVTAAEPALPGSTINYNPQGTDLAVPLTQDEAQDRVSQASRGDDAVADARGSDLKAAVDAKTAAEAEAEAQRQAEAAEAARQAEADEAAAAAQTATQSTQDTSTTGSGNSSGTTTTTSYPTATGSAAADAALSMIGVPYAWGGTTPSGFDCSGLMMWAYAQQGVSIPRDTYGQMGAGTAVSSADALQPGDLVFFYGGSHVGMYIGGGNVVHAPTSGQTVTIASISSMGGATAMRHIG